MTSHLSQYITALPPRFGLFNRFVAFASSRYYCVRKPLYSNKSRIPVHVVQQVSTQPIGSATLVTPTEKKKEHSTAIQEQAYQFSFDQAHQHSTLLVVKTRLKRRKNIQRQYKNKLISFPLTKLTSIQFC